MKVFRNLSERIARHRSEQQRAEYLRGQLSVLEKLSAAKHEHIQDLRQLLDQARSREDQLAGMVRMVMEERFYRPVVTKDPKHPRARVAPLEPEALQDVATFDQEADAAQIQQEAARQRELEQEFEEILHEENEHRAERGAAPVAI